MLTHEGVVGSVAVDEATGRLRIIGFRQLKSGHRVPSAVMIIDNPNDAEALAWDLLAFTQAQRAQHPRPDGEHHIARVTRLPRR